MLLIHAAHFFINNCNMNPKSVEKQYFVSFNGKLQVRFRSKTFCRLLELLHTAFTFKATAKATRFARKSAYPSNNRVIYGPELNL